MSKKINIGGRLHSTEQGNVVTGANEVLDDTKGKKQNVINADVDAELLRLDQSKQNNLMFDNTPTENSNNPVKSSGVYAADKALSDAIDAILILIPSAATALNQLADKNFVNSSIATDTATFRGTSETGLSEAQFLEWANGLTHDMNDYVFWQTIDEAGNTLFKRYKWNGTQWLYEYTLNNSSFTADQWAAITSGITTALVEKLVGLPTNTALQQALNSKQDALTFDNVPTENSNNPVKSGGVYSAVKTEEDARLNLAKTVSGIGGEVSQIEDVIPTGATSINKLVENASMEAYVASIIQNITSSFTLATADGHINLMLTQTNGQVATLTLTSSDIASAQDVANLQQLYNNLQQSKPVPVTALPETGQQQGVIYRLAGTTSYSDYMWNGSTWVLMATYNNAVDPRPKKASQNLVTSGGVFDNMGALDVSELNATENPHTPAIYVDLSAAIATIPTDYQKGGMSIKFIQGTVQSSDNKYIQARCMAQNFTTDVTQWQGVDAVPTAGSDNLVKSGGVQEGLQIYSGNIDLGTTYNQINVNSRVNTFYPINDVNAKYAIKLSNVALGGDSCYLRIFIAASKTAYGTNALQFISDDIISDTYWLEFTLDDNIKSSAKYIVVTEYVANALSSFKSELVFTERGILDYVDAKTNGKINTSGIFHCIGIGTSAVTHEFKTIVGHRYSIALPKNWSVTQSGGNYRVFMVKKVDGATETSIASTEIYYNDFATRPYNVLFDAETDKHKIVISADAGQGIALSITDIGEISSIKSSVANNTSDIYKLASDIYKLRSGAEGVLDPGTNYNKPFGTTKRVCVFYPILDKNALYVIRVSDIILGNESDKVYVSIRKGETPYDATLLYNVGYYSSDSGYVSFRIPEECKGQATHIGVNADIANGGTTFKVELKAEPRISEIYYLDNGTIYADKYKTPTGGVTNRTCAFFPIPDKNAEYYLEVYDIVVPATTNINIQLKKAETPYDGTPAGNTLYKLHPNLLNGDSCSFRFKIPDEYKTSANFISICQADSNLNTCSFKVKLAVVNSLNLRVDEIGESVNFGKDTIPYNDTIYVNGRTIKVFNPYKDKGTNQYTGQMHCHSWNHTEYHGVMYKVPINKTVEQIAAMTEEERVQAVLDCNIEFAAAHKREGYDFMTITNYDTFGDYTSEPEELPENFIWLGNGFEATTGPGWDSTGQAENNGAHINIINTDFGKVFAGCSRQEIINYCEDRNCIATYNHPFLNMLYSSPSWVKEIKSRLHFIEVFNGLGFYHEPGTGDVPYIKPNIELDECFDALLSQGNLVFCTGVSDERHVGTYESYLKRGCVKVFANELSHKAIVTALLEGKFYASQSSDLELQDISLNNNLLSINVGVAGVNVVFMGANNTVLSTVTTSAGNTIATYAIQGTEKFVRARIYKDGSDPTDVLQRTNQIWTQAIRLAPKLI